MGRSRSRSRQRHRHREREGERERSRRDQEPPRYESQQRGKALDRRSRSRSKERPPRPQKQRQRQTSPQRERQGQRQPARQRQRQRQREIPHPQPLPPTAPPPLPPSKELPCWSPSGILLTFYNSRQGVALKYHQPPCAKLPPPSSPWRIYPFLHSTPLPPILLTTQTSYLIGKDERVCDILLEHPTVSRQHAVLQFREVKRMGLEGWEEEVKLYLVDLESVNGTFLNGERVEEGRYVEVLQGDKVVFGEGREEFLMIKEE